MHLKHVFSSPADHPWQITDSVNGQIYNDTLHARYSRAPLTSTIEAGLPSTTARKGAKSVRSDARHPSHFHTTLQQYRSKSTATKLCAESSGRLYLGLRQRNLANDLPGNWPLNTQLLLLCLDEITYGH